MKRTIPSSRTRRHFHVIPPSTEDRDRVDTPPTAPSEGPEAQPQAGFARHAQHVAAAHEALKAAPRPNSIRKEAVARTSTETPALPGGRDAPDQGGLYAPQAAAGANGRFRSVIETVTLFQGDAAMFNHAPAPKPPQEPAGAVYPLSEAAARSLAQPHAADHVIRLHRARQPAPLPSYERRTDAEARALIEQGRRGIETIGKARQRLADKRVDAEAAIKTEETAIQTLQSVYSTGMELFVANTGARRPEPIADELAERRARLDRARKVFIAAQADEVEAEQDFTDATDAANDLIRVGKHHLMLNSADKLADRLESAMTETINADAALRKTARPCDTREELGRGELFKWWVKIPARSHARTGAHPARRTQIQSCATPRRLRAELNPVRRRNITWNTI